MFETVHAADLRLTLAAPAGATQPPVLLVHGFAAGAWMWEDWQRMLAEHGFPTYALDLRGRPGSRPAADFGRVTLHDYADDVCEAAAFVARRHGVAKPLIVGHSMGGLLAQMACERDAVLAAAFVSAAPPRGIPLFTPQLARRQLKHVPAMAFGRPLRATDDDHRALTFNRTPDPDTRESLAKLGPESGTVAREISLGRVGVDARRVRCPVISISASDDRFVPVGVGRKLATKYQCPWWLYEGHAHNILGEPGWERPAGHVGRWLAHAATHADRALQERTWSALQAHIGDEVTLRFFDDRTIRAEVVNVDNAARLTLVFETIEVLDRGQAPIAVPAPGDIVQVPVSEIGGIGYRKLGE